MRILHCLRAPVGGLFRHVCDLAAEQAARGHMVGLIADSATGGTAAESRFADIAPACRLGIVRLPMSRRPGPSDVVAARRVLQMARACRPDVLHGHGAKGGVHARLAAGWRGKGRPLRVYTPHGGSLHYDYRSPAGFLYLTAERLLARHTDLFLFESAYARRVFEARLGPTGPRSRVVHNGIGEEEFEPVDPDPDAADVLYIGEIRRLKGIDVLLAALARLAREGRPATAVIVGDGPDLDEMMRYATELGLQERVRFAGRMPAREAFPLGRWLVVPSRAESLPYIVLEGAAARLPIVATNVGGVPEIFGRHADRLVQAGDPDGLAEAIVAFRSDPAAAARAAATLSEEIASRFTISAMADGVLDAYQAAMQQPAVKAS